MDLLTCFSGIFMTIAMHKIWIIAKSFAYYLKYTSAAISSKRISFSYTEIELRFNFIRELCRDFNNLYGHLITTVIVEAVIYYAIQLEHVVASNIRNAGIISQLEFIFYVIITISFMCFAVDINQKAGTLKDWLGVPENRRLIQPPCEISLILDQLNYNALGIKASNAFPIIYGLAASVSQQNLIT